MKRSLSTGGVCFLGSGPMIAARRGRRQSLPIRRLTVVTLQHLFGIVPKDVTMRKNSTSAATHSNEGRPEAAFRPFVGVAGGS